MKKLLIAVSLMLALTIVLFCGCTKEEEGSSKPSNIPGGNMGQSSFEGSEVEIDKTEISEPEEIKSGTEKVSADATITLNGETAEIIGNNVSADGGVITISAGGEYLIKGTLDDGCIIVDSADEKNVKLILDGADIHNETGAAIYVKSAKNTHIILTEGSINKVSDGESYIFEDETTDEPNAAVFSKDDLKIKGKGMLYVNGNYMRGIHSKDDLEIEEAELYVVAVDDGIRGKDSVQIYSGTVVVEAGADGIRTNNSEEEGRGYILIEGGKIEITAEMDAIQAVTDITISGGDIDIYCGGGSANSSSKGDSWGDWGGGGFPGGMGGGGGGRPRSMEAQSATSADDVSAKGIKAVGIITISGGEFNIDSSDDSVHSNDSVFISGGNFAISSGDDGMHADTKLEISGGYINITKSYEGIEASDLVFSGGETYIIASDDGINAAGGNDSSSISGRPGQGMFSSSTGTLAIKDGKVIVNSSGDGIDVNGSLSMTGGNVRVYGPTNGGNGTMDYDGEFLMKGGEIVAFGSTGMAQGTSSKSSQPSLFVGFNAPADSVLKVTDSKGKVIIEESSPKPYGCVLISTPEIKEGEEYFFYLEGTELGSVTL